MLIVDQGNENIQEIRDHLRNLDLVINVIRDPRKITELPEGSAPDLILMAPKYLM